MLMIAGTWVNDVEVEAVAYCPRRVRHLLLGVNLQLLMETPSDQVSAYIWFLLVLFQSSRECCKKAGQAGLP